MLKVGFKFRLRPQVVIALTVKKTEKALELASEFVRSQGAIGAPVDQGTLRSSIRWEKRGFLTYIIGPTVFYGLYQEVGTRYIAGKHYMKKAYLKLTASKRFSKYFERMW